MTYRARVSAGRPDEPVRDTMTDMNEAIARWMGWRWLPDAKYWLLVGPNGEHVMDASEVPRYTESLDEQVPVWEELRKEGCEVILRCLAADEPFYAAKVENTSSDWGSTEQMYSETSPAEAAARAIHAALVALGEVEDAGD